MQPLVSLTRGLEILEPFLRQQNFEFDHYENGQGAVEQFTVATYKKESKKFIISYLPNIGLVDYQFNNSKVYHNFYLDQLGLTGKKKFKDFQSADKLLGFKHILNDFEFLVDDFFQGPCTRLKAISKLQDTIINEYNKKAHEEFSSKFDSIRIETAREEFNKKDFKKCLGIYKKVENKLLLNNLDKKLIEYCERHIL